MSATVCDVCLRPARVGASFCHRCGRPLFLPASGKTPVRLVIANPRRSCHHGGTWLLLLTGLAILWLGLSMLPARSSRLQRSHAYDRRAYPNWYRDGFDSSPRARSTRDAGRAARPDREDQGGWESVEELDRRLRRELDQIDRRLRVPADRSDVAVTETRKGCW